LSFFLSKAVEANQCYFFENRLIKLKCPHLLNVLLPMVVRPINRVTFREVAVLIGRATMLLPFFELESQL
jgi:hypothetical protein